MKSSKLLAYSEIATKTLVSKSSSIMGLVLMSVLGLAIGIYLNVINFSIVSKINNLGKAGVIDSLSLNSIKGICFVIVFLLFGTISGLMQSVISDKDNNVIKQIGPLISEQDYILGKQFAAFVLLVSSIINSLFGLLVAIITNGVLQEEGLVPSLHAFLSLFSIISLKSLLITLFIVIIEFITLCMFTLMLAGRINKMQEAPNNALMILSPIFITIFLLILPNNISFVKAITSIAMYCPLISIIFDFVSLAQNGFNFQFIFGLVVSVIYIILMYLANLKLYQYFLYSDKKFSIHEVIKILKNK